MLLRIGRVGKPHGLRGEVKVIPETEDPGRVADLDSVFLGHSAEEATEVHVDDVRFQPHKSGSTTILLALDGYETLESAESLRGKFLYARESDLPALADGEWFLDDLSGMEVQLLSGERLGVVKEVWDLPNHPILVVQREGRADAMIPAVDEFVKTVDATSRIIVVATIEGLVD